MTKYITRTMAANKYRVLYYDMKRKVAVANELSCYPELMDKNTKNSIELKGKFIMEENGLWEEDYKILTLEEIETGTVKLRMNIKTFVQFGEVVE